MTEKFDLFIIDDNPDTIEVMMLFLSNYSIKIKAFVDPLEGIKELINNPPRVVFLDYNMPLMDGKKFIIKMSEHYLFQYSSVYLITGMDFDQMTIVQLQTLGFSQIIQKPFSEEDLVKALSETIGIIKKNKSAA